MMETSQVLRDKNHARIKELRKEFEELYWNTTEARNKPTSKDYMLVIIFQNMQIIDLLKSLNSD